MINQNLLATALGLCAPLAQGSYPILKCVKLEMRRDNLQMTASNLQASLILTLPAFSAQEAEVCVDASRLNAVVRAAGKDDLILTPSLDHLHVQADGRSGNTKLVTLPAQDYPDVEGEQQEVQAQIKLPVADLLHGLAQVRHAVAVQDVRFYLLGVLMQVSDGTLHLVATDGARLSACDLCKTQQPDGQWILPAGSVDAIRKLAALAASDADATLTFTSGAFALELVTQSGMRARLHSKLIAGHFPDWRRVIPKHERKMTMKKDALMAAFRQVVAIAEKKTDPIAIKLHDNRLTLHRVDLSQNESSAEVEVKGDCEPTTIGIAASYLSDVLGTLHSDEVEIAYHDGSAAIVIQEDTTTHIIMPMRL